MNETEKTLQVINIDGIDCYELNGVVYLKLETVARGLGFTQIQNKNGKSYTSIRWDRIEGYLSEFGFPHKWGKDDYIPENIFYRLAMKAKNQVAERFQAKVADEIIPTIRRTGSYGINNELEEAKARIDILEREIEAIKSIDEKLDYLYCMVDDVKDANSVLNSSNPVTYEECVGNTRIITDKRGQVNHVVQMLLNTGLFESRSKLYSKIYKLMSSKRNVDINKAQWAYSVQNGINIADVRPFDVITNVGYVYKAFMEIAGEMVNVLGANNRQTVLSREYVDTKERIATEGYSLFGLYPPLIYKKIYRKMHDEYGVDWKDYDGNGKAVKADENLQKMFVEAFNLLIGSLSC